MNENKSSVDPHLVPEVNGDSVTKVWETLYVMPPVHGYIEHITGTHHSLHALQLLQTRELVHVRIIKVNLNNNNKD